MANLRLALVNHLDAVTPTVTSEATNFPVTNLRSTRRGDVWRSDSTASQQLIWAYPSELAASVLVLVGHNLAGGTARLRLLAGGSPATAYDSGALTVPAASVGMAGANYGLGGSTTGPTAADDIFGNLAAYWLYFSPAAFDTVELTLTSGPDSDAVGYLELGRAWLAMHFEAGRSADFGVALSRPNNSGSSRTRGGSLLTNRGQQWRRLEFDLGSVPPSERAFWDDVQQYAGTSRDVLVDVFPGRADRDGRDHRFCGEVAAMNPLVYEFNYRKTHLVIEET